MPQNLEKVSDSDLVKEIKTIKAEVDTLQIEAAKKAKPWYQIIYRRRQNQIGNWHTDNHTEQCNSHIRICSLTREKHCGINLPNRLMYWVKEHHCKYGPSSTIFITKHSAR